MKDTDFMNEPKSYIQEVVEYISVKRKERLENAVFGEIKEMVKGNEHFTMIELNETAIIDALKKQIPIKPYTRDLWELGTAMGYFCPTCGYDFPVNYFEPHCCKCGQAIKYTDHPTEKGGDE